MSFIKLNDQMHTKFFTVAEGDCRSHSDTHGEVSIQSDTQSWPTEVYLFRSREDAGQYVRDYWEDFVNHESPDEIVAMMGAETLISWALGRLAGPGTIKVKSLEEWLDLYLDVPEKHFEEEFDVDAIGENIVEILGFKPAVAFWNN